MNTFERVRRHVRLMRHTSSRKGDAGTPPFLILFINSLCNQTCEHCFFWQHLNQPDDLTFEEITRLSEGLGRIENLNLSGGEPFLAKSSATSAVVHPPQRRAEITCRLTGR